MSKARNPLDDENYWGNDAQIADLKSLVLDLHAVLKNIRSRVRRNNCVFTDVQKAELNDVIKLVREP